MDYTDASNPTRVIRPKSKTTLWLLLSALIVSLLINGVFLLLKKQATNKVMDAAIQLQAKQAELATLQATSTELASLTSQARSLHAVFNNQKNFDSILSTVQTRLYKNSSISTLQLNDKGEVTVTGTVSSYEDYAKFYESLTDKDGALVFATVKPVAVGHGSEGEGVISFTFTMVLQPSVLAATRPLTVEDLKLKVK